MAMKYGALALTVMLGMNPATAGETRIHLEYNNGASACVFTSNNDPAVELITSGPNAGDLRISSAAANPFSGNCGSGGDVLPSVSAISAPAAATIQASFSVGFTTTGSPDYCTSEGSSFPAGSTVTGGWAPVSASNHLCDGAACAAVNKTILASAIGTHVFAAKCYKGQLSVPTTAAATVNVTSTNACLAPEAATSQPVQMTTAGYVRAGVVNSLYERSADASFYEQIFGFIVPQSGTGPGSTVPFPGPTDKLQPKLTLMTGTYFAMRFTVPTTLSDTMRYRMLTNSTHWRPENTSVLVSVSPCPGRWTDVPNPTACRRELRGGAGDSITMTTGAGNSALCHVEKGQTYYMNFTFGQPTNPATSTCPETSCSFNLENSFTASRPGE